MFGPEVSDPKAASKQGFFFGSASQPYAFISPVTQNHVVKNLQCTQSLAVCPVKAPPVINHYLHGKSSRPRWVMAKQDEFGRSQMLRITNYAPSHSLLCRVTISKKKDKVFHSFMESSHSLLLAGYCLYMAFCSRVSFLRLVWPRSG